MKKSIFFATLLMTLVWFSGCIKEVEDNAAPYIILTGANPTYVRLNTPFRDSGILVTDNYGVMKVWNDTTGLNIHEAGRYSVKYFAEDFNGNISQVDRKVVVRIEGQNLSGKWTGSRISPYPGGPAEDFSDSLVNPATRRIYFTQIGGLMPSSIKGDLLGTLGDTIVINKQILSFNDTATFYFLGAGTIAHDGKSFSILYQLITESQGNADTAIGQIIYQK